MNQYEVYLDTRVFNLHLIVDLFKTILYAYSKFHKRFLNNYLPEGEKWSQGLNKKLRLLANGKLKLTDFDKIEESSSEESVISREIVSEIVEEEEKKLDAMHLDD